MGSGNKLKRKQKNATDGGGRPSGAGPAPTPFKDMGRKAGADPKPGVVFDLEPDADELFRSSMHQLDRGLMERAMEDDDFEAPGSKARGSVARGPRLIDLHGMTLEEARWRVEAEVDEALAINRGEIQFRIVTGKGLHSGAGGAVLPRAIHRLISEKYARRIIALDESPEDVKVGGVPLRGHFDVKLRAGKV